MALNSALGALYAIQDATRATSFAPTEFNDRTFLSHRYVPVEGVTVLLAGAPGDSCLRSEDADGLHYYYYATNGDSSTVRYAPTEPPQGTCGDADWSQAIVLPDWKVYSGSSS